MRMYSHLRLVSVRAVLTASVDREHSCCDAAVRKSLLFMLFVRPHLRYRAMIIPRMGRVTLDRILACSRARFLHHIKPPDPKTVGLASSCNLYVTDVKLEDSKKKDSGRRIGGRLHERVE